MKRSLLYKALQIANEKLPLHPELENFPHYAFVVQGNTIVEWATNSRQEPPKHWGYHRRGDLTYRPKLHAEICAYRKARGLLGDKPFEIINVRLNKSGLLRLSRPCKCCAELLTELGCLRFYYSSEVGFLVCV